MLRAPATSPRQLLVACDGARGCAATAASWCLLDAVHTGGTVWPECEVRLLREVHAGCGLGCLELQVLSQALSDAAHPRLLWLLAA